jgi:hypothetical protein
MKTDYQFPIQVMEKAKNLGYTSDRLSLLLLTPFLQVAWAEGFVQASEQKAILRFAANLRVTSEHSVYEKLLEWFDERPSEQFFDRSIEDLRLLLETIPPKHAARLRAMLQFGCVEVAHASGDIGLLRGGSNIRREEREQLRHLGERLGLAHSFV